jgi:hypothetical protein
MGASPGNKKQAMACANLVELAMQRYKRIFRNTMKGQT